MMIPFLHKRHPAVIRMSAAAKPFWWPQQTKEIQTKCDECIPCRMATKPETLQIYSFASKDVDYEQLVLKTLRRLKCDNLMSRHGKNARVSDDRLTRAMFRPIRTSEEQEEEEEQTGTPNMAEVPLRGTHQQK